MTMRQSQKISAAWDRKTGKWGPYEKVGQKNRQYDGECENLRTNKDRNEKERKSNQK